MTLSEIRSGAHQILEARDVALSMCPTLVVYDLILATKICFNLFLLSLKS